MKKYSKISVVAMLAMVTMCVFSACGGDDDNDLPGENEVTIQYVEPCFNWGASAEEVKDWMTSKPYKYMAGEKIMYYESNDGKSVITYMFDGTAKGLYFSLVSYATSNSRDYSSLISQTEKRYDTKMTKMDDQYEAYTGYATINGRTVGIMIQRNPTSVDVLFQIPE